MPHAITRQAKPDATALNAAFEALKAYDHGSSRAALVPIDEAVVTCLGDKSARKELERRLVNTLNNGGSFVACEYVCSKLKLIGTDRCVPALAELLNTPELATAARNALEAIPDRRATKVLRDELSKLEGSQKVGVLNSLGARHDTQSVRALATLLKQNDMALTAAAIAALGDIANVKAAKVLAEFWPSSPVALRLKVADACLACAERLLQSGRKADAQALCRLLHNSNQPKHVQHAAARSLQLTAKSP